MNLQNRPASARWQKFGKCCASCDADEIIEFRDSIKNLKLDPGNRSSKTAAQRKSPDNTRLYDDEPGISLSDSKKQRDIRTGERIITTGRVLGAAGGLLFLVLIYTEHLMLAVAGLFILLTGILLCRIGVLRIARCRRSVPIKPIKSWFRKEMP
ncbi:MAG: hypothetical protein V2I37_11455 [Marinilabiliaceae bacterium]|nr:hypothetical protein [Marinilabiliaceae bacterium]